MRTNRHRTTERWGVLAGFALAGGLMAWIATAFLLAW